MPGKKGKGGGGGGRKKETEELEFASINNLIRFESIDQSAKQTEPKVEMLLSPEIRLQLHV